MDKQETNTPEEAQALENPFLNTLQKVYKKFNLFAEIKPEDHIIVMIGKIIVRIIGFILLLILSPFLFIGLMIAFALAG
ncbi:MAG: hypothetical protein AAF847_17970 [Bacteroidota bacterium]